MVLTDDWKNNNLCSEGDIKPAVTKLINLQSIYNQCSEGGVISNKNLYYDEEYMLSELKRFYKDTGYIPNTSNMRRYNGEYPTSEMFTRLFGSFGAALKRAGFDRKISTVEKGKKAERIVKNSVSMLEDTSRKYWLAPYDLICSRGYKVDVKGSSLRVVYQGGYKPWRTPHKFWSFNTKRNTIVDYYICLGFDTDYKKLEHMWLFKNDSHIKSKIGININDKYKNEFIKNELDLNRCNLDMKLDLYTY